MMCIIAIDKKSPPENDKAVESVFLFLKNDNLETHLPNINT